MGKKRDLSLDIAKGICITLMVVGHGGCPDYLHRFIYMFHMPCFFFISGMLLSDKYITDIKTGVIKKLKGYYLPFVKWSIIFVLLHNLFYSLQLCETNYSLKEIGVRIVSTFFMVKTDKLLGGYWFMKSIIWASIGSVLFLGLLKRNGALNKFSVFCGVAIALLIAAVEHLLPINVPQQFEQQTFLAFAFFVSGYVYKIKLSQRKPYTYEWLLWLIVPAVTACFIDLRMLNADSLSFLYYVIAICGTIGVIQLCKILQYSKIAPLFNYIGNRTLYILTFHLLAFKIVTYASIQIENLPMSNLKPVWPIITNDWIWIFYTIVGVAVPLLLWELFHFPERFRQK